MLSYSFPKRLIAALVVLVVIIAVAVVWRSSRQRDAEAIQSFIETRYANEVQELEAAMLGMRADQREDYAQQDDAARQLRQVFDAPEIFEVGWSDDSHHGSRSIKPMPTGFSTHRPFFFSADWSQTQRHLFFGKSFNGERLLIYEGWLPQSHVKRDYSIVFYEDKIRALMTSSN